MGSRKVRQKVPEDRRRSKMSFETLEGGTYADMEAVGGSYDTV